MTTPQKTKLDHAVDFASAALNTIPFTGGLAKYLDEYYPSQQKRMLRSLADDLLRQASTIDKLTCDLDRLGVMVNETVFQLSRTSSEYKKRSYYNLLLNFSSGKTTEDRTLEYYMHILSELTELQLQILVISKNVLKYAIDEHLVNNEDQIILQHQIDSHLVMNDSIEIQRIKHDNLPDNTITPEARDILHKVTIDDALATTKELSYPAYRGLISKSLLHDLNYVPRRDNPYSIHFAKLRISDLGKDFVSWIATA